MLKPALPQSFGKQVGAGEEDDLPIPRWLWEVSKNLQSSEPFCDMSDPTMYFAQVSSPEHLCWALLEGVTEALQHKPQLPVSHYLLIWSLPCMWW